MAYSSRFVACTADSSPPRRSFKYAFVGVALNELDGKEFVCDLRETCSYTTRRRRVTVPSMLLSDSVQFFLSLHIYFVRNNMVNPLITIAT